MKLYMSTVSQTSRPVRLLIAEKGIDVEEQDIDLMTGEHHKPPFVALNPSRQVPVLEDGDLLMTESSAILKYLADKFEMPEYPRELKTRAKVNEMMDWFNTGFYRDWGYNLTYPQLFDHHKRPSAEGQKIAVEWGRDKSQFWLGVLNDSVLGAGQKYLVGNNITIADYFGASLVALGELIRFDLARYPNVVAWEERVKALKSWSALSAQIDGYRDYLKSQEFVR